MKMSTEKISEIQSLLDEGKPYKCVSDEAGIHTRTIYKLIKKGTVEIYNEQIYLGHNEVMNFEWLYEEDKLDEIAAELLLNKFVLPDSDDDDLEGLSFYCKKKYGDIVSYLSDKHSFVLADNLYKRCRKCKEELRITEFYKGKGLFGYYNACSSCEKRRICTFIKETQPRTG